MHSPSLRRAFALTLLLLGLLAQHAAASHFRFANLSWKRAAGTNALAVEITVTEAWRTESGGVGEIPYSFGDGSETFTTAGATRVAELADAAGEQYEVWRYTTTHTYPSNGVFTVTGSSCCRIGSLVNASSADEQLTMVVDLRNGNTGSPVTAVPVILQMQAGTNNSIALPIVDPDGDGFQVRMATTEESSISAAAIVGMNALTVTSAGVLNWNTVGGLARQKFAVQVIVEENRAGNTTGVNGLVPLDFIIELVGSLTNQPPSAIGTNGSITLLPNQTFTTTVTGTDPEAGPLLVNHQGLPPGATISPANGTTNASPTPVTFSWTPTSADAGSSYAVLIFFTDQGGQQAVRSFALTVAATARTNDFDLISVRAVGAGSGNGPSLNPVLSTNGQFVAFVSDATDLVAGDSNGKRDVFWRDRGTGTTRLVSRTTLGTSGNGESDSPAISADGRYVAFHSRASNFVTGDTNASHDVFVWDSQNDTVTLVSRTPAGRSGAGDSFSPKLAANGRTVIFLSTAGDLVSQDANNTSDVFSFNLDTGAMTLVSVNLNGFSGNGACGVPVLSADGRHVAFLSRASDLVTNDFNTLNDVFVRDLQTGITRLVSVNAAGTGSGNRLSFDPVMSADGRIIAFGSQATDLVALPDSNNFPDVFVRDMQLGITRLASVNRFGTAAGGNNGTSSILPASFNPFVSADGSKVLFTSLAEDLVAGDSNAKQDIFLYDVAGQTNTLISVNKFGTGSGNGASGVTPQSLSTDGRYVAFFSDASDIGSADLNGRTDIFLRDLATNATKIISRAKVGGFAGNGNSYQPAMSADGATVLFTSDANNFVPNDSNSASDIFTASSALGAPEFGVVNVGMRLSTVGSQTVGTAFNVVLSVTNLSANPATGLGVAVVVPAVLDVSGATASQGTIVASSGVWQIGDLAAGARATLTLSLRPLALAASQVSASAIRLDQPDSDLSNNSTTTSIVANRTAAGAVFHLAADTAYLSRTNSPYFAGLLAGTFTLEDFESGLFNLAGVTASAGSVLAPSANTDSVDADDGLVDGSGNGGRSFLVTGTNALTFTFNPVVLGRLPTKVGIVLTDGDDEAVGIEAFDVNGVSLGITSPAEIGEHFIAGATAEDRFLGVEFAGGISALRVYYPQAGFEVDHLQFDVPTTDLALGGMAPALSVVGSNFAVTFSVTNLGPTVVTNATVTNANPGSLTLVSSVPSQGSFDGGPGIWTIGTLAVGGTASLTLTLSPGTVGALGFSARVLSELADRNSGNDSLAALVLVPNQRPVTSFVTNLLVSTEDAGMQTLAAFAALSSSEVGQVITNLFVTNSNPALFAVQPAIGLDGTLTFTPAANANGSAVVTLVVQDNGGTANGGLDKTTNNFTLILAAVNDAPSLAFTTNLVAVLEDAGTVTLPGFATVGVGPVNESAQTITNITVRSLTPALFSVQPTIAMDGTLTFRSAADAAGSAVVEVVAQDDGGTANGGTNGSVATNFTITIAPLNDAPSITFNIFSLGVAEDSGLTTFANLIASFNPGPADESGQTVLGYTVTNDNPSLFAIQPAVNVSGTLTFQGATNATGTITVSVVAQDSGGTAGGGNDLSAATTFFIILQERNDAPSFTFASNSVTVLEDAGPVTVTGFIASSSVGPVQEVGNQSITNYGVTANDGSLFSVVPAIGTNGVLTFTPAANANGTTTVTVVARDNGGTGNSGQQDSVSQTFTIALTPVNDAPSFVLVASSNQTVETAVGAVAVPGFVTASSVGPANESGQAITNYQVSVGNAALFTVAPVIGTDGTLSFTVAGLLGSTTVSVAAQDDGGVVNGGTNGSALQTFTITINAPSGSTPVAYVWQSGTGNWQDRSQWLPNGVPGAIDSATISAGTVQLTNAVDVATLIFSGGNLDGAGVLTVRTNMAWTAGTMAGTGKTVIETNAVLTISGAAEKQLNRQLDNHGTVTWTGARITGDSGPVINNLAGGLFDIQTDATLFETISGGARTFNNSGTVLKSAGTGTTVFNGTFNNNAMLELKQGILSLTSGYAPAAGSSLKVSIGGLTAGTDFGQLQVTGVASLAGALEVALTGGFVPTVDSTFAVVTAGTRAGTFGSTAGLVVNAQRQLNPLYRSADVNLVVSGQTTVGSSVFHHGVPYTSRTNSPWAAELLVGFLHFYDFEVSDTIDSSVATNTAALHSPAGGATDSVDADDGAVDGSGNSGASLRAGGLGTELTFSFQTNSVQPYPVQAGLVFTDGDGRVIFEAFAADGNSLGAVTNGPFTSSAFQGDVSNDRFFGVENASGISAIKITSESGGLEVDHLQFKIVATTPLPSNATVWLKAEGNGVDEISSRGLASAGLFNGVSFATGKVGQAFSLDGVDDFVVTPGVGLGTAEASGFTVEFWFKPSVNLGAGNGFTPLAMQRAEGESFEAVTNSFDFYYEAGFLRLAAGVEDDMGNPFRLGVSNQVNLVAGTWYHLAVVANTIFDEVSTYAQAAIYVNGVKAGSSSAESLPGISGNTYVRARNAPVLIGRGEVGGTTNYTAGLWDEFTACSSGLSGEQIAAIVRANEQGKSLSTLLIAAVPGGGYVLTWPDGYRGYVLEWSPTLGAGVNWRPVSERITAERGQQRVLIPASTLPSGGVFYRLQRPPTHPASGVIR